MPENSSTDIETTQTRPSKWKIAAAALLAIALVSTLAQWAAIAVFAPTAVVLQSWSTGGLVALVGAAYLGAKCVNWADFWRKLWVWAGAAAVLGFAAAGYAASQYAAGSAPVPQSPAAVTAGPDSTSTPTDKAGERADTRWLFDAGLSPFYSAEFGEEPSEEFLDSAFEFGLQLCEKLDEGQRLKTVLESVSGGISTEDDSTKVMLVVISSIRSICPEYDSELDKL